MSSAVRQHHGRHTVADWEALDHNPDGPRVELIDGVFVVSPAPGFTHQRLGDWLCRLLEDSLWDHGQADLCAVTAIGVKVAKPHGFIPDIVVVRKQQDGTTAVTAADVVLAVEIVSPRTRKQDRTVKPDAYAAAGVRYFWRVEPTKGQPPAIVCFELEGGTYVERATVHPGSPATVAAAPVPVKLDVDELYRRVF